MEPSYINIKGRLRPLSPAWVLGIVNVTPDSFWEGSRTFTAAEVDARIAAIRDAGATGVDIGGYSTRPGADEVTPEEEYRRLSVGLESVRRLWPEAVVSVDTFRADVARRCVLEWGADIINDISGGDMDPDMFATVADTGAAYVLMHTRGTPQTMTTMCDYADVTAEVISDLAHKASRLALLGVRDILIDPGFGFAKDVAQNYELMRHLEDFAAMGYPLFVGISRKSMIYKPLGLTPADSLPGTVALNAYALEHGASILRVHDVPEALQTVKIMSYV